MRVIVRLSGLRLFHENDSARKWSEICHEHDGASFMSDTFS